MKEPELRTIPTVVFAHKFSTDKHHVVLESPYHIVEITGVLEGSLTVRQNGVTEQADPGDIITNFYRSPLYVDTDKFHIHQTVCFGFDPVEPFYGIPLVTHAERGTAQIMRLIGEIIRVRTLYPEKTLRASGLFMQLIGELCSCSEQDSAASPGDRLYVKRAKEYIFEHITEPIMQKNVASHLGITPEYLCTIFKKTDGRSVIRFINELKLENVRNLMETRNIPLWQAAAQYGFSDPNYVSKLYKKYYGHNVTNQSRKIK